MYIDSHCHLAYEPLIDNIEKVLLNCEKKNVKKLLTIGTNLHTSQISSDLSLKYKNVYSSIGIHPNEAHKNLNDDFKLQELYKTNKKNIAFGETGLDYYYSKEHRYRQLNLFERHINFAQENNSVVIVHTRDAEQDTASLIYNFIKAKKIIFIIHCFTGSIKFAKILLDMGCYISFSGIITFKNSQDLQNVVKYIPLDRILIETDSPFLSPDPLRGKKNYPENIEIVAKKVAEIKKITTEEIGKITSGNFNRIFNL